MKATDLTAETVRAMFDYDPLTGRLSYREDRRCGRGRISMKAGDEAGTQRPTGYRLVNIGGKPMLTHRLAWLHVHGEWPQHDIDHINGDPSDNRLANLRDVPHSVNQQNLRRSTKGRKHGTLMGTAWHAGTRKWRALIAVNGRQKSLGYFATEEQAHQAYIAGKRRYHEGCTI